MREFGSWFLSGPPVLSVEALRPRRLSLEMSRRWKMYTSGASPLSAKRGWRGCRSDSVNLARQLSRILLELSCYPGGPEILGSGAPKLLEIMRSFDRKKMYSPEQYNSKSFSK